MQKLFRLLFLALALFACSSPSEKENKEMDSMQQEQNMNLIGVKYKLPPLSRMSSHESRELIDELFMVKRIAVMKIDTLQLHDSRRWEQLYDEGKKRINSFNYPEVIFKGHSVNELNAFLKSQKGKTVVISKKFKINSTVLVPDSVVVDGQGMELDGDTDRVFVLSDARHSGVKNFQIRGDFNTAIYIKNGNDILVDNIKITGIKGRPFIVMGVVKNIFLTNNHIENNGNGGIYIRGNITSGIIENNKILYNHGADNFSAGLLISDLEITDPLNPEVSEWKPIDKRYNTPRDIIIIHNNIIGQNSSGIYMDGPISLYVIENLIAMNDKEGACLDNGTTGVHFIRNTVVKNGGRLRQSDENLKKDFVLHFGRMADGGSKAKLPGISLDNAIYNVVMENNFNNNYGSGIKMVRSSVRNIIGANLVNNNNAGRNDTFHFFGIELGHAPADQGVLSNYWNHTADFENIIFANVIQGPHYAGVFLAEDVYLNDIFDNIIMGASNWSIESITAKHNTTLNNLSNLQSRGIPLSSSKSIVLPEMIR